MNSAICTLFEGNYHFGVAAMTNSLFQCGFRGNLYAGYRGELPQWAEKAEKKAVGKWDNAFILTLNNDFFLIFIPLNTDYHLTNYKPDFMLELIDGPAKNSDALFYVDPDICFVQNWSYFEEWVTCGISLCEDVNSPIPENHPRRVGWRRFFFKYGYRLKYRSPIYVNGGFVGVARMDYQFIELWKTLQISMVDEIGSLAASKLNNGISYYSRGFAGCFDASDQDALNAALEITDLNISIIGQEAMGFKNGGALVPHALGPGKPWQRKNTLESLQGRCPRLIDKVFWRNVTTPIKCFNPLYVIVIRIDLLIATAIGRFWRRL